jgi:hypothetical protein
MTLLPELLFLRNGFSTERFTSHFSRLNSSDPPAAPAATDMPLLTELVFLSNSFSTGNYTSYFSRLNSSDPPAAPAATNMPLLTELVFLSNSFSTGKVYPEIFLILSCQSLRHEPWPSFTTPYLSTGPLSHLTSLTPYFPRFIFYISFPSLHTLRAIPTGFCLRPNYSDPPASPAATDMPLLTELVFLHSGSAREVTRKSCCQCHQIEPWLSLPRPAFPQLPFHVSLSHHSLTL